MRYGSPRTGLNNINNCANKGNEFMKVISINLAEKHLRNSLGSRRAPASTSPGHFVEKGTWNIRLTGGGGPAGRNHGQLHQAFRTACGGSTLGGRDGPTNNQKYMNPSKNRKIKSIDLTALLREQPTGTLMPNKNFQAIRLKQFHPAHAVGPGSPSSAQGPNATQYSM